MIVNNFPLKATHLEPYKNFIHKCIESSVNPEQLQVCHDMMIRLQETFKTIVTADELRDAIDYLSAAYLQEQAAMMV